MQRLNHETIVKTCSHISEKSARSQRAGRSQPSSAFCILNKLPCDTYVVICSKCQETVKKYDVKRPRPPAMLPPSLVCQTSPAHQYLFVTSSAYACIPPHNRTESTKPSRNESVVTAGNFETVHIFTQTHSHKFSQDAVAGGATAAQHECATYPSRTRSKG